VPPWIDAAGVAAGDVPIRVDPDGRFRGHIEAAALIAASPERVWDVLRDCESAPDYVPNVLSCTRLETLENGRVQIFRQEVKFAWFLPRFEHVFRLEFDPYRAIRVRKVSGPLKRLDGVWSLLPNADGGTLVIYSLDFEAGLPIPEFVIGATLKKDLPRILRAVRSRAERTQ
jgi:ribosome-associated toxin RatA of RatAB toxin-antitoxin module